MKATFFFLVSLFSLSAFAQPAELVTVLNENKCIDGKERKIFRMPLPDRYRETTPGKNYFGATSYGDVVVLLNNTYLEFHLCSQNAPILISEASTKEVSLFGIQTVEIVEGSPKRFSISGIQTEESGENCSFGEILVLRVMGSDGKQMNIRSPRFSDEASLCNLNKISVSDAARDAGKDVEEAYKDAVSGSKVSGQ